MDLQEMMFRANMLQDVDRREEWPHRARRVNESIPP